MKPRQIPLVYAVSGGAFRRSGPFSSLIGPARGLSLLDPPCGGDAIFPYNPIGLLEDVLAADRRPPDGKLHASSHLVGSLRHVQLEVAQAPTLESLGAVPMDTASEITLAVGTAIHTLMEAAFRGKPVMQEVKLDQWMPEGLSGTADCIGWDAEHRCFVLADYKTVKPGSLHYVLKDGAKEAHIWQVSAYWHALADAGLPMLHGAIVVYLPKGQLTTREGSPVYPSIQEITPLPREQVHGLMAERKAAVDKYLASVYPANTPLGNPSKEIRFFLTDALAPVQPRDVRMSVNKTLKRPVIDVKLTPNWSTDYCPFPDELCNCRHQTDNKIGHWDRDDAGLLAYIPSKNQPADAPADVPTPDPALVNALVKAQKEKESA